MPLNEGTVAAVTEADLHQRIATLADDAFEGRAPGAEIGELTADWVAAEYARLGLEPGGENGSWFQTVEMVEQTLDPSTSRLSISDANTGEVVDFSLGENAVMWTKRQDKEAYEFDASDLVFVGYGVVAPEYGWNDYDGLDVRGKTVVMLVNDPGYARGDDLFRGRTMTYYGRWTYKFEEAARQGATGAIIVHETAPASYGWNVVANSWSGAQADLVRENGGTDRTLFESWITLETARDLFRRAGQDFDDLKRRAMGEEFTAVPLEGLSASGRLRQTVVAKQSRNVIGVLPGTEAPDEYVAVMAHWDHLGKKPETRTGGKTEDFYRDDIFNGAVDNATGMAGLLEIAEAAAAERHRRSLVFLSVTLEESGLLGSAYYAEYPTVPMSNIVAGVNMDAILPVGRTHDMVVIGDGASELEDLLRDYLADRNRVIRPDTRPEAGRFYRSDHISFAKKGVPMLYTKQGIDKLDGGAAAGQAFLEGYNAQFYHKPMDEYSEQWDLSGMEEDIAALSSLVLQIADSDEWPSWYPGTEFKSVRDASLSADDS